MKSDNKFIKNNKRFILMFTVLSSVQLLYLKLGLGGDEAFYLVNVNNVLSGSLSLNDPQIGINPVFNGILFLMLLIFGKSVIYPKLILFLINSLNAILLFKIVTDFWDEKIGKVASILFLIGILIPAFESHYVLTEPFMLFFGLIGTYLFLKCENQIYLLLAGVSFSISSLCKTIGLLYVMCIGLYFIFNLRNLENQNKKYIINSIKKMSVIIFGFMLPVFIGYLYFYHINSVSAYFIFPLLRFLPEREPLFNIFYLIKIFISYSIIWIFSLVTICIFGYEYINGKYSEKTLFILICFFIFLYPLSSRQFGHYFIPILPSACILTSICIVNSISKLKLNLIEEAFLKRDYIRTFTVICMIGMIASSFAFNLYDMNKTIKNGKTLHNEQLETSNYIKAHTSENNNIFIFDYEPSIYYLSDRKPVAANILIFDKYRYNQTVENEIINKLKTDSIYVITAHDPKFTCFENLTIFVNENYQLEKSIGRFNIYSLNPDFDRFIG